MSATAQSIPRPRSRFFSIVALALVLFMVVGFLRTYYLRFLSDLPPLNTLFHVHGLVFTAWLVLFIVQTRLVAAGRVALHRNLGLAGVVLAVMIVGLGVATVFAAAAVPKPHAHGLTSAQASIVPLVSILEFALALALGLALRRRAELHKRFMVLAMIGILGPPTGRLIRLLGVGPYGMEVQMGVVAAFVAWCLVWDWRRNRVVHPVFAVGGLVLVALWPVRFAIGGSAWWQPIGEWIARAGS